MSNILLLTPIEIKAEIFPGDLKTDSLVAKIKHQPHLYEDLEVPKDVEDLLYMAFMWLFQLSWHQ